MRHRAAQCQNSRYIWSAIGIGKPLNGLKNQVRHLTHHRIRPIVIISVLGRPQQNAAHFPSLFAGKVGVLRTFKRLQRKIGVIKYRCFDSGQ